MAPSFLSKFVNKVNSSSIHGRGNSTSSKGSSRRSSVQEESPKKAQFNSTASTPTPIITVDPVTPQRQSFDSASSDHPNVTIIPPSPLSSVRASLASSHSDDFVESDEPDRRIDVNCTHKDAGELSTLGGTTTVPDTDLPPFTPVTPATARQQEFSTETNNSRPCTPSSTSSQQKTSSSPPMPQVRPSASNRSLNVTTSHARAATAPETTRDTAVGENGNIITVSPIVESPTTIKPPEFPSTNRGATLYVPRDSDAISLMSTTTTGGTKEKRRPWKKSTSRKPSGLAGAIAASGMAMAHPTLSASHQASFNAAAVQAQQIASSTIPARKSSNPGSPPSAATRSPPGSSNHIKGRSADLSPRRTALHLGSASTRRRPSASVQSDNSDYYPDDRPEYFSGLEASSDEDDDSGSSDVLADLGMDDMPVTGFAVASYKRNADFHELFPTIPEGDYLIEDYGCALQREILIQGRLYISENHICFHANIFGWITNLSIPTYEIISLEKKMTAFVIPNAIQITTRQAKYTFASFLSRDTTYDVIYNIWRLARPDDVASIRPSIDDGGSSVPSSAIADSHSLSHPSSTNIIRRTQEVTKCLCPNHYSETAMDCIVPGSPDRIQNLMFASGFIKEFMAVDQKLLDIQISDWQPTQANSNLLARNMSYIKPLNASLGPKQTKCEIRDEMVHNDPEQYISTVTTTRTPDVPSGGVFSVKTRTCLMWASPVSTRILVTTQVEWTGRSFIRSIIERSAIDGQKTYHNELETAMRKYIQEHQSEFVPEGIDASVLSPDSQPATNPISNPSSLNPDSNSNNVNVNNEKQKEEAKRREQERNQRGLQWAYDTFSGAFQVAKRSTKGALELITDAWEQSSSTTIMWFVIVALVLSNLWTITMMGSKEEIGRRKEMKKMEEREKWVQGVVTALWDELGKKQEGMNGNVNVNTNAHGIGIGGLGQLPLLSTNPGNWKLEIGEMERVLDQIEQRMNVLKGNLRELEDGLETTNLGSMD